jgi:hypothetical protein
MTLHEAGPTADLSGFDLNTVAQARKAVSEYMDWIADTGGDDTGKLSLFAQDALVHQFATYLSRRPKLHEAGLEAALLPCPLCGGKAYYYDDPSVAGKTDFIECGDCSLMLDGDGKSSEEAAKLRAAWNRRVSLPAPQGSVAGDPDLVAHLRGPVLEAALRHHDAIVIDGIKAAATYIAALASPQAAPQGPAAWWSDANKRIADILDAAAPLFDREAAGATQAWWHARTAQGAEPVQPVAWWVHWPNETGIDPRDVFADKADAEEYRDRQSLASKYVLSPLYLAQPQASREARDRLQQQHDDFAHKAARETDPRLKERWSGIAVGLASAIAELARPQP